MIDIDVYKEHTMKSTIKEDSFKFKIEYEANLSCKNAIIESLNIKLNSLAKLQEECNKLAEKTRNLHLWYYINAVSIIAKTKRWI